MAYYGEHLYDFFQPKFNRYGLYYNELPFYWEGCKVRLVHISDYVKYHYPIKESVKTTETQMGNPQWNKRKIVVSSIVDPDADSVTFTAKIYLSGQYSTLGRSAYGIGPKDKSVNMDYRKPIWKFLGIDNPLSLNARMQSFRQPYIAEVDCIYGTKGIVENVQDTLKLDLSNWFPHVIEKISKNEMRYLNFYNDFMGEDEFEYTIQTTRVVQLLNPGTVFDITNPFGAYKLSVTQLNQTTIKVNSVFKTHAEVISPVDFDYVVDIYSAIKNANQIKILVK